MGRRLSGRLERPRSLGAPLTILWLSFSAAIASSSVTCAMPLRLAGSAVGPDHTAIRGLRIPLGVLAAKSAHGVTGVATFILLADIGNQRFRTLHFDFEGGDQRVFRVNDNVSRFPLNFKTDRKLHLRALPLSANVAHSIGRCLAKFLSRCRRMHCVGPLGPCNRSYRLRL
jgi:hypothetical protein